MALFTVVIPLFNKAAEIEGTLASVLAQTEQDFDIIVVNDGSTDDSAAIVRSLNDPRIELTDQPNQGVGPARNKGVGMATSPWIAFMDADDYWYPHHLADLKKLIDEYPEVLWMATAYEKAFTPSLSKPLSSPLMNNGPNWFGPIVDYFTLAKKDAPAWTSAVGMRRSFFNDLGGFDTDITMGAGEDTDLWIRAALRAPLYFNNRISSRHRQYSSNRISHAPTLMRRFIDLDRYEADTSSHPGLKAYLDLNRYSIGIKFKMAGDRERASRYFQAIKPASLNVTQRLLMKLPGWALRLAVNIQGILAKFGLRLSAFNR